MTQQTYPYDVFVSYSHKNQNWVKERLLPKLQQAQINFAWDLKDFLPGKTFNSEMLRLIRESKHTLIILTKDWIGSNFTDFEFQLSRALDPKARESRLLILNVDGCEIPRKHAHLTTMDAAVLGEDAAFQKLVDCLLQSKQGKWQLSSIWGDFKLWKDLNSNPGGGYQYAGKLTVGNPVGPMVEFDSILINTHVPEHATARLHAATSMMITFTNKGMTLSYSYDKDKMPQFYASGDGNPEIVRLESGSGVGLQDLNFGPIRGSLAGKEPVICSMSLYRGQNQVSAPVWCVLPPVARLTQTSYHGQNRFDASPCFELQLLPEKYMSPKTCILEHDVLDSIFETAGSYAQDSLLLRIRPQTITVHTMQGGAQLHTATGWKYVFLSESKGGTFEIAPDDPNWVDPSSFAKSSDKPGCWLSENLLYECWLDASFAYLLALPICSTVNATAGIVLEAVTINGVWQPVWRLPRSYESKPVGVLANSGEVVVFENGEACKPRGVIWNS